MFCTIIFIFVIIFSAIWTINWLIHANKSRGHFWSIVEIIFLWILVVYFFFHPEISRFHLLWLTPLTFIIGFLVSGVFFRAFKSKN